MKTKRENYSNDAFPRFGHCRIPMLGQRTAPIPMLGQCTAPVPMLGQRTAPIPMLGQCTPQYQC